MVTSGFHWGFLCHFPLFHFSFSNAFLSKQNRVPSRSNREMMSCQCPVLFSFCQPSGILRLLRARNLQGLNGEKKGLRLLRNRVYILRKVRLLSDKINQSLMSLKLITKKKIHQILNAYKSKLQKYKLYEKLITYLLFFSVHYTETQTDS